MPFAVIFDMDGVIIDSHRISLQLIDQCARSHGIELTHDDRQAWLGLNRSQFWQAMKTKYALPRSVQHYAATYPIEEEIRRYADLQPIPGVAELIHQLHDRSVPLALATSGHRDRMDTVLDRFSLRHCFRACLSADDVATPKPDPQIFHLAARRLDTPAHRCLVIEDSSHGVEAAKNAGMTCIGFVGLPHVEHDLSAADLLVRDFTDLTPARLQQLLPQ